MSENNESKSDDQINKPTTESTETPSTPDISKSNDETVNNNNSENKELSSSKTEEGEEEKTPKNEGGTPTSVQDIGVCADQNWKYRRRMEDAHHIEDAFGGNSNNGFFGVYDGHGGKEAAIYASEHLHKMLASNLEQEKLNDFDQPEKVLETIRKTYLDIDEKMKTAVPSHHGCTSVTCLVTGTGANRQLFSANVGDARAVLCRDGKAIRLTEEHKASEPVEAKRIISGGGFIIHGRVNGQIIITRSLGDHLMKEFIIGDPFLHYEKLTEADTWLIVACDGLWDVVDDQPAVDFVLENKTLSAPEISKKLLIKALQDGTTDNLSIMVVKL